MYAQRIAHSEAFEKWMKETFLSRRIVRSKVLSQSQEKQGHDRLSIETSLPYLSTILFLAQVTIDHNFSTLLFLVHPHLVKVLAYTTFSVNGLLAYSTIITCRG